MIDLGRSGWIATVSTVLFLASCSLLLQEDAEQCSTNEDCTRRGGAFTFTICDQERKVCTDQLGTGGTGATDGGKPCQTNTECSSLGRYLCIDGQCTNTIGTGCGDVYGDASLKSPDVIAIGLITSPESQTPGLEVARSVEAATKGYNTAIAAYQELKPIAVIRCDEADPKQALDHLAALKVKTVIGPVSNEAVLGLVTEAMSKQITLVTPLADDPRLEAPSSSPLQAVEQGYLYHVHPNRKREVKYFQPAVQKIFEILQADPTLAAQFASLSVALVTGTEAGTQEFVAQLGTLPANWKLVKYEGLAQVNQLAAAVRADPVPNLIVAAFDTDANVDPWREIIKAIEAGWPDPEPRPYYVLQDQSQVVLFDLVKTGLPPRIFGISPRRPTDSATAYADFKAAYNTDNNGSDPALFFGEYGWDAFHVAAYGVQGALKLAGDATDGSHFKTAVETIFLTGGTEGSVTTYSLVRNAIGSLGQNDAANLNGASGRLEFDPQLGSPTEDALIYCYPDKDPPSSSYCETGFVLNATTGAVTGTNGCDCP